MEGPVKERLTGALILIAALVIVVPEMLSGPGTGKSRTEGPGAEAGPPLRTYQLQLDTPTTARSEDQSALSPKPAADAATPPAVVEAQTAAVPAEKPLPAPVAAASKTPPAKTAEPAPEARPSAAAAGGSWWAQLGSFSSRDNAERLARELRAAGYAISVSPITTNGKELFRVRAGPVTSREAAVALQGRLAAAGHKSSLVAPQNAR